MPRNIGTGDGGDPRLPAAPLSRAELVESWRKTYRQPPPKRTSTRLLILSHAYHQQAAVQGGLGAADKRLLLAWAVEGSDRKEAGKAGNSSGRSAVPPGSRLIREWHGETHLVDVLDTGYRYQGRTYRSLSEIARLITGTRWSGPRFFGLGGSRAGSGASKSTASPGNDATKRDSAEHDEHRVGATGDGSR